MTVRIDDAEFRRRLLAGLTRGLQQQGALMVGHVKEKISRSQPSRTSDSGRVRGLDPSKPGEPPKQLTTRLKMSITFAVESSTSEIALLVGTNVKYARALELGFSGTRADGKVMNLAARPYLRPSVIERMDRLARGVTREVKREFGQ